MAIPLGFDFERTSPNPIDSSMVLTKAEMKAMADNKMPDNYFAVCKDDGKMYTYDKSATPNAETGKFSVLEGGSGNTESMELTQAEYDALTPEEKNNGTLYFITDGQGGGGSSLPAGGTTGQALVKKSDADGDVEWADGGGGGLVIDTNNPCSFNEFTAAYGVKPVWINGLLVVGYINESEDVVIYTTAYKTNSSAVYYRYYSFTSVDHTQPMVYNSSGYSEMTPDFATSIGSIRTSANIHKNNDWLTLAHDSSTDLVDTRFKQGASILDIQIPTKKYVDDNTTVIVGSDWGVAKEGFARIPNSSSGGATVDVDISDLNLASDDDYEVLFVGMSDSIYALSRMTATSFTVRREAASPTVSTVIRYVVFAKGYGGKTPPYSTNEQAVGKWIDGKTLYQKSFEIALPNREATTAEARIASVDVSALNIDVMTECNAVFGNTANGNWLQMPLILADGVYGRVVKNGSENLLEVLGNFGSTTNHKIYATIKYTKKGA